MAQVTSEHPSADWMGHVWPHAGASVEMGDDEAAALLEIAGPNGGYVIVPPPVKRQAKKAAAVSEPGPKQVLSEVTPEGNVTEDGKS